MPPAPFRLRHRLLQPADVEEALAFLPPWLGLPDAMRAALPALWRALLDQPGFNADVIEDLARPPGQRLMGLGMSVALDAAWCRRLAEAPPAYATRHLYGDLLSGRTQLPGDAALARANAGDGVSFMVLHYRQHDPGVDSPAALSLWSVGLSAMRSAHAGHRVRQLHQEAWGDERQVMHSVGMHQRTSRSEAAGAAPLPELFGPSAADTPDGTRGPEKKRALVSYLRQHPEELRPYAAERRSRQPIKASPATDKATLAGSGTGASA